MRIALCSYSQKEKETALLMKLGKVDRFDNGVFCTYAMQRDGPYDAVVVMEDGARGMNFCMSIRGYSRDVPLLWISDVDIPSICPRCGVGMSLSCGLATRQSLNPKAAGCRWTPFW